MINANTFIAINLSGIFLFSKSAIFISSNDLECIKTEPNKVEDNIIKLYILLFCYYIFK